MARPRRRESPAGATRRRAPKKKGNGMAEDKKTPISGVKSYQTIGEFWDNHDLGDYWDKTKPAEFEISIGSERRYYPIDKNLSNQLKEIAQKQGISAETLINLWVQEKLSHGSI